MKKDKKKEQKDSKEGKSNEEKSISEDIKTEQEKKMEEYLTTIQHLQAEYENYRKRIERDKEQTIQFSTRSLIEKLLPVLDNFERSLESKKEENHKEFVKAIEMTYAQLWDVLSKQGLEKIDALDKKFDPQLHEPLLQEKSDKEPNTIIGVLENGYKFNDKVIRHSRVKVSK